MRQALSILVPLLLPTAAYFLYVYAMRRRQPAGGADEVRAVPWAWLAIAGALLLAISLGAYALFGGAAPGSRYQPPKLIDGEVQPGEFAT